MFRVSPFFTYSNTSLELEISAPLIFLITSPDLSPALLQKKKRTILQYVLVSVLQESLDDAKRSFPPPPPTPPAPPPPPPPPGVMKT
ncbi:formin-like protein 10 isoform X2 [Actinia tenebrosa]|uniref:Formin-like protein 10 isoform X2 n=1 Tax=Actinia tenebrosa TaxID=6105 RepID=A0A6P8J3V4_ACTTE|nr:formin-like protein 10 isoform X2 [Actinia tenebrosa]